jgi:hypothetical protein
LPVGEVGVGQDGVAPDGVEGDRLGPEVRRGGHGDGRVDHVGIVDGPAQDLHPADRAADHGQKVPDAQLVEQQLLDPDHVGNRDDGEVQPVGPVRLGVDR